MEKEISRDYVKRLILDSAGDNVSTSSYDVTHSISVQTTHADTSTNVGAEVQGAVVAIGAVVIT